MRNYKKRIYDNYFKLSRNPDHHVDQKKINKAYSYYFRKWLPSNKNSKILDLGCGSGHLLIFLKSKSYLDIVGVDTSIEQVKLIKDKSLNIVRDDIFNFLEKNDNLFDIIFLVDVIEHLNKEEVLLILEKCFNALNLNGRIIIRTPNGAGPFSNLYYFNDFTHEQIFNSNTLKTLFRISGFRDFKFREENPIPIGYSILSSIRYILWQFIRLIYTSINIIENGEVEKKIYTKNIIASAIK